MNTISPKLLIPLFVVGVFLVGCQGDEVQPKAAPTIFVTTFLDQLEKSQGNRNELQKLLTANQGMIIAIGAEPENSPARQRLEKILATLNNANANH